MSKASFWLSPASRGWLVGTAALLLLLSACSKDDIPRYPPQIWEDITVEVETRPTRITRGMIEFLVIATRPPRRPAHDLIVSIRINDKGKWHQAIQDGHVGVYRRAIFVNDPQRDVLVVKLQRDEREGILYFPLRQDDPSTGTDASS